MNPLFDVSSTTTRRGPPWKTKKVWFYIARSSATNESVAILVARVLAQALSNLVTGNDILVSKLWTTYMNLPEDQVVLMYGSGPVELISAEAVVDVCSPILILGRFWPLLF